MGKAHMWRLLVAALAATCLAGPASATPLSLAYTVVPHDSGAYRYSFTLTLDNHDGSWAPGQNFNWIVFGDAFDQASPLSDFVGEQSALPIGPFDFYSTSGGAHNGPTLLDLTPDVSTGGWVPIGVGSSLSWSGTSSAYVDAGSLLFSNLIGSNFPHRADFEVAALQPVPEPSQYAMMLAGLLCVVATMFRASGWRSARTKRQ